MSKHRQGFLRNLKLPAGMLRLVMNLWPPFVGAGIHVTQIAADYRRISVRLRLGLLNRNYMGTQFGGSLFAMTDPFFVLMLVHNLGRGYTVWDKASSIRYRTPGRGTVHAHFTLTDAQLAAVLAHTADGAKYEPTWSVDVVDGAGKIVATVDKTLYIQRTPRSDKLRS